jgi:hypothetical protein
LLILRPSSSWKRDLHLQAVDHAKGPARGRPFVGKRRAEARSATASSAPFGFARAPTSANQEPFFFFFFDAIMNILQVWTG